MLQQVHESRHEMNVDGWMPFKGQGHESWVAIAGFLYNVTGRHRGQEGRESKCASRETAAVFVPHHVCCCCPSVFSGTHSLIRRGVEVEAIAIIKVRAE